MRLHPDGPPHATVFGAVFQALVVGGLAVGMLFATGAWQSDNPAKFLWFTPVAFSGVAIHYERRLRELWSAGHRDRVVVRTQDLASSWAAASLVVGVFYAIGVGEYLVNS